MTAHCVQCSYDLEGLPPTGVCPECGLAVAQSLAPRVPEPESRGARCWHTGVLAGLALLCVAHLLRPYFLWYYGPTEYDPRVMALGLLGVILGAITLLIDIASKAWGPRMVLIFLLAAALWIPTCSEFTTTR